MNPSPAKRSAEYFTCRYCGKRVKRSDQEDADKFYPFCSQRCKLADLGTWLEERYRIPGPPVKVPASEEEKDKKEE